MAKNCRYHKNSTRNRRAWAKKWIAEKKALKEKATSQEPCTELEPCKKPRKAYKNKIQSNHFDAGGNDSSRRIVSDACLLEIANASSRHAATCTGCSFEKMDFVYGKIELDCSKCRQTLVVSQDLGMSFPYKKALALSVFASGTGLEAVNTILTTLQIPSLTLYHFQQFEEKLFCELDDAAKAEYDANAQEEGRLALEVGELIVVDGAKIPYITVVVDGGWSKRSYGHKYDSKSGVAIIIGARTKKVLFMGTKIKICAQCSRAERDKKPAKPHRCFKNWNDSPQAMEAAIIVEGFLRSYERHGLIYRYMVGDADSSVFMQVKSKVHYPGGVQVQKVDCVNHALRCLNTKLFGITKNTLLPKCDRDTIVKKLEQFGRDARGAIDSNYKIRSNNAGINAAKLLFDDLINIPQHVFGDHTKCRVSYCKNAGRKELEEIGSKGFDMVTTAFNQIAQRSDRLIYNVTSNLAEGFMAQMSRYCSGKRCNQNQRYGYPLRSLAAVFAYNYDQFWPAAVYKKYLSISNKIWDNKSAQALALRQKNRKTVRTRFRAPKRAPAKMNSTSYGEDAEDDDICTDALKAGVNELSARLQVTREQRDFYQKITVGQAFNDEWKYQRRERLTASVSGKIFKMRDSTKSASMVKSIVYPVDLTKNENIRRGINLEPYAKRKYEEETGNRVEDCGLFIYVGNGVLAASPDGLVEEDGIIEIKCPNVPPENLPKRPDKILLYDESKNLHINVEHPYYYQIHMQLYVSEKRYCDFVVYHKGESCDKIFIQRVEKTPETDVKWNEMEKKLVRFYMNDLGPELFCPRLPKGLPIREPEYRVNCRKLIAKRKADAALKPRRASKKLKLVLSSADLDM